MPSGTVSLRALYNSSTPDYKFRWLAPVEYRHHCQFELNRMGNKLDKARQDALTVVLLAIPSSELFVVFDSCHIDLCNVNTAAIMTDVPIFVIRHEPIDKG